MSKSRTWSLSTLNLYEQCPYKYKAIKLDKRVEPPSVHLTRGLAAHEDAENYLLGKLRKVPYSCYKFTAEMINLLKHNAIPEEKLVLNANWESLNGEWNHKDTWLRAKTDARVDNTIIDFKTGKHYSSHEDQARLYANIHMKINPNVDEVTVEFWYLTSGKVIQYEYHREMLELDINGWNTRVKKLMTDETLEPTVNQYCSNCFIKSECPKWVQKPK